MWNQRSYYRCSKVEFKGYQEHRVKTHWCHSESVAGQYPLKISSGSVPVGASWLHTSYTHDDTMTYAVYHSLRTFVSTAMSACLWGSCLWFAVGRHVKKLSATCGWQGACYHEFTRVFFIDLIPPTGVQVIDLLPVKWGYKPFVVTEQFSREARWRF